MYNNKTKNKNYKNENKSINKIDSVVSINNSIINKSENNEEKYDQKLEKDNIESNIKMLCLTNLLSKDFSKKELNQTQNQKQYFLNSNKHITNDNNPIIVSQNKKLTSHNNLILQNSKEKKNIKPKLFNAHKFNENRDSDINDITLSQNNNQFINKHKQIRKSSQNFTTINNAFINIYNISIARSNSDINSSDININDINFSNDEKEENEKLNPKYNLNKNDNSVSDTELENKELLNKVNQFVNLSSENSESNNDIIENHKNFLKNINMKKKHDITKGRYIKKREKCKDSFDQINNNITSGSKEILLKKNDKDKRVLIIKKMNTKINKKVLKITDSLDSLTSINFSTDDTIMLKKGLCNFKLKKNVKKKKKKTRKRKEKKSITKL